MTTDTPIVSSKAMEDFLKAVYALEQQSERVSTNDLKDALAISAPSVTDMAQRLQELALLDYRKYHGVRLTDQGRRIAIKIIRRHRLIETYLVIELGYALHEVHAEAESLEHAVSDRFVEALAHKLDYPSVDPHGDPIPTPEGLMPVQEMLPLCDLPLHTTAWVARYAAPSDEMLRFIIEKGFHLHRGLQVDAREPFEGPTSVRFGEESSSVVIGASIASVILVTTSAPS